MRQSGWGKPLLILAILFAVQSTAVRFADGQSGDAVTGEVLELESGKPIERELSGGQKQVFQLALHEGQFIRVVVKQKGIDVGVNLQLPNGEVVRGFQPFGGPSELSFSWMAESSGTYRVEVYSSPKASSGRYEITLAESRAATEKDRVLQQARVLFAEYGHLQREARYGEAITVLKRVLELREQALGPNDLLVATTLGFLASAYNQIGDTASAEPLYLRALKINEKLFGLDSPEVIQQDIELAGFYSGRGDYAKAEELNLQALAFYERTHQTDSPILASLLAALGEENHARGDYENAEKYYERSRIVWAKIVGPDHFHLAPSYTHLGRVAYDAGDYAKAEAMFQRALVLTEKGLGAEHTSVTKYRNDLAMLYCTTGNYDKGEALYQQSLTVHQQKAAMGHPVVQETLLGLARCDAARARISEAAKFESEASELEERYASLNLAVGSEREKLALLASLPARLSRNISLHVNLAPNDTEARNLAMLSILRRKGRVQDAVSAGLASLRCRFDAQDQKLFDQLNATTTQLARVALGTPQGTLPGELQKRITALEEQREKLEEEISRRSAGFYQHSHPVTLDTIQHAIPNNAALIEFAVYRPFDPKAPENDRAYSEPRYVAYVLHNQGEVRWVELGEAKEIDSQAARLREALRDPQRKDVQQIARALDEKVMRPIRSLSGDASQLLVSPDGDLNLIPFDALVDERGQFLVQRYSITYLTSGRDLLRMQVARESKSTPVIIANPLFGEPSGELFVKTNSNSNRRAVRRRSTTTGNDLSEVYFAPLSGTDQEARSIHTFFPDANVLTGAQATESAVKQVNAPSILHIATHGFFLSEPGAATTESRGNPTTTQSSRANKQAATRAISATARIENPLLRSGLALAGANLRDNEKGNGILTALEASGMNLWGTKLVVLSACDTGVGEVHNGEGVYGLRRAFALAGAESLVMSLWPISDFTTRTLMTGYYRNLKAGMGRGAALRQVQLDMLNKNPHLHPFYWANFIQAGEWANLDGKR